MTVAATPERVSPLAGIAGAAATDRSEVVRGLGSTVDVGLCGADVIRLQARFGPNAVSSHRARLLPVLWHQLKSPLLALLLVAALASYFVGERSDALIIGVIVALPVGLGFVNEYRAEKAAEGLHDQIHHETTVIRDGRATAVDVTTLVPGDVLDLHLGHIVPADLRLLATSGLACDESVLTGESLPVDKSTSTVPAVTPLAELSGCALMGTVVEAGSGRDVVVSTGPRTEFGIEAGHGRCAGSSDSPRRAPSPPDTRLCRPAPGPLRAHRRYAATRQCRSWSSRAWRSRSRRRSNAGR